MNKLSLLLRVSCKHTKLPTSLESLTININEQIIEIMKSKSGNLYFMSFCATTYTIFVINVLYISYLWKVNSKIIMAHSFHIYWRFNFIVHQWLKKKGKRRKTLGELGGVPDFKISEKYICIETFLNNK